MLKVESAALRVQGNSIYYYQPVEAVGLLEDQTYIQVVLMQKACMYSPALAAEFWVSLDVL